jgi:hypothetical protein
VSQLVWLRRLRRSSFLVSVNLIASVEGHQLDMGTRRYEVQNCTPRDTPTAMEFGIGTSHDCFETCSRHEHALLFMMESPYQIHATVVVLKITGKVLISRN